MIIIQDRDNELYFFNSITEAESDIEAIDVENNEFINVCDEEGNILKLELLKKPGFFRQGSFRILSTDKQDRELPKRILIDYGKKFMEVSRIEEVINTSNSIKEAFDRIEIYRKQKKQK